MFLVKLLISNLIIIACVLLGRRWPPVAGLIAAMPLTTLIVLIWLYSESYGDSAFIEGYLRGVFWGLLPTAAFFMAMIVCLRKGLNVPLAVVISGLIWLAGAGIHRWWVR